MAVTASAQGQVGATPAHAAHTIPVLALGMSLSAFLVISYVICILGYLLFPGLPISHSSLSIFLPGFELLTWRTFLLGLVESFGIGWYVGSALWFALQLLCGALALGNTFVRDLA
jgi:hypothetical protein